jgi:uncharacterized protein YjbI with pentapeptide repeats
MGKKFLGKWQFSRGGAVIDYDQTMPNADIVSEFFRGLVDRYLREGELFVLYGIGTGTEEVVIQSNTTGKYLKLEKPLGGDPNNRPCFTAFTASAEFDEAFRFVRRSATTLGEQGCLDTSPPSPFGGKYRLCLQSGWGGTDTNPKLLPPQLGFRATDVPRDPYGRYELTLSKVVPTPAEIRLTPRTRGWFVTPRDYDLSNVDLSGEDLSGVDLQDYDLRGANLIQAKVDGLGLPYDLNGADLSNLDLTHIVCDDAPPSICGSEGKLTSFKGAKVPWKLLGSKDWSYVDLDGATIVGLEGADLSGIKAVGANLSNLDLSDLTLDRADFTKATIKSCSFAKSRLRRAHFDGSILYNTKFISSILESAIFQSAQLGGIEGQTAADLSYAYMPNVDLRSANLYAVNMVGVSMFGGETKIGDNAILDSVNLTNAYLVEINFKHLNMRGATLDNACLINADFTGSDLSKLNEKRTSLTRACLQGADFSNAKLEEANLAAAAVSFDKGDDFPVQYRDETGELSQQIPHHYKKTSGLDKVEALPPSMTCPNRKTVEQNNRKNISLKEMLTAADAPKKWVAPA